MVSSLLLNFHKRENSGIRSVPFLTGAMTSTATLEEEKAKTHNPKQVPKSLPRRLGKGILSGGSQV